jgi:DNA-binding FrmR family transcriptional regulator
MIAALKNRALHRAKIIEGQVRGLHKMIEQDEYCIDIVTQSLAIQKSLGSLNKLLIENHLKTHVAHAVESKDSQDVSRMLEELVKIFELNNNRGSSK